MRLYFIGIVSSDSVNQDVREFKQYMFEQFNCKAALDITLVPPFYFDPAEEDRLVTEIQLVANAYSEFPVELENFAAFAPRVIYVNVKVSIELQQLHDTVNKQLVSAGFNIKVDERKFTPHVTIATRDLSKYDFPAAFRHFENMKYAKNFPADGIVIFRNSPGSWDILHHVPFRVSPEQ